MNDQNNMQNNHLETAIDAIGHPEIAIESFRAGACHRYFIGLAGGFGGTFGPTEYGIQQGQ
jgi:hypothetical protein